MYESNYQRIVDVKCVVHMTHSNDVIQSNPPHGQTEAGLPEDSTIPNKISIIFYHMEQIFSQKPKKLTLNNN